MKQYMIDELRLVDYEKIKIYLNDNFESAPMDGIYWIPLDREILTKIQAEHTKCQPFYFAIDIEPDFIACELLVRSKNRMRCDCVAYATEKQRNQIIRIIDSMFDKLEIKI